MIITIDPMTKTIILDFEGAKHISYAPTSNLPFITVPQEYKLSVKNAVLDHEPMTSINYREYINKFRQSEAIKGFSFLK